ncbi:hypothetical protein ACGFNX_39310 [Streptomyces sp. NPDC048723]
MTEAIDNLPGIPDNVMARLSLTAAEFMPDQGKPTDHVRKNNGY